MFADTRLPPPCRKPAADTGSTPCSQFNSLTAQDGLFFQLSIHALLCSHAGNKGPPPSQIDVFIFHFWGEEGEKERGKGKRRKYFALRKGLCSGSRKLCHVTKQLHGNKGCIYLSSHPAGHKLHKVRKALLLAVRPVVTMRIS